MKFRIALILLSVLITFQSSGQNKHHYKRAHGKTVCKIQVYGTSPTIEPGERATLNVQAYDSATFNSVPVYSISWAPASSVLYPTAANTPANPKTTTTYTVTVNTSCGILTDTVTVHIGCSLGGYINSTSYYCSTDAGKATENIYNGVLPYTYLWSDGETTSTIAGLNPGNYKVMATDSLGCTVTDSTTVTIAQTYISTAQTIEPGDSTTIWAWAGDPDYPYIYSWAPASSITNPDLTNVWVHPTTNTTYTVTVNNSCGVWTDTVSVDMGCSLYAYTTAMAYICPANEGSAGLQIGGGTPPYSYLWNTGQTTSTINNLTGGSYSCIVTDSYGCKATSYSAIIADSVHLILWPPAPNYTIEPGDSVYLWVDVADSSSSSIGPFNDTTLTYSWAPAASVTNPHSPYTEVHPKVTTTYTITVNTSCGSLTDTITVSIGCGALSVNMFTSPYYCAGDSGSAVAYATDGPKPYTYLWSTGQTTSGISGLVQGSYYVTVTDSFGCSSSDIEYVYPGTHYITLWTYSPTIAPGDSAFIITYTDTLSHFKYSWAPAATVTNPDSANTYVHPAVTTTYTLTAITPCGILTDTVVVNVTCNSYNQQICIVTTDTAINKNVIVWGRNNSPPNGSFNVYRLISSGWLKIASVPDTALSEYIDTAVNPSTQSYSYKISTVDSCGESALSLANNSIFLQVLIGSGKDSLSWTPYIGFTTTVYKIYRGPAFGALTLIDSVSSGTLYYVDVSPPPGSIYLVEAENPAGSCVPTHRHTSPHEIIPNTTASFSNGGIPHKPSGIEEISPVISSLTVSPNPSNGLFSVSYNLTKAQNVNLSVIDAFGRIIYNKEFVSQQTGVSKQLLDLEYLADGIYSLRIFTNDGIAVKKIVILKR